MKHVPTPQPRPEASRQRGFIHPRLVVGILIILLGTLFLLDNLDVMRVDDLLRFWPLFPLALGLTMLAQPAGSTNRFVGAFLAIAGVWLLLNELDILDWWFWDAWPVLLIGFGGWMVWRSLREPAGPPRRGEVAPGPAPTTGRVSRPTASAEDTVSAFAFLCGIEKVNNTKDFRGGELTAMMGGCEIDLRDASIGDEPAVIDVFAFWGGVSIRVPEDWIVTNKVMPLLGGLDDKTRIVSGADSHLLIRGSAIMGGVEVKN